MRPKRSLENWISGEKKNTKKQAWVSRAMAASCFHAEVWVELACCGWKTLWEQRAVSWTLGGSMGWRDKLESRRTTKARTIDWNNCPPCPSPSFAMKMAMEELLNRKITTSHALLWLIDYILCLSWNGNQPVPRPSTDKIQKAIAQDLRLANHGITRQRHAAISLAQLDTRRKLLTFTAFPGKGV